MRAPTTMVESYYNRCRARVSKHMQGHAYGVVGVCVLTTDLVQVLQTWLSVVADPSACRKHSCAKNPEEARRVLMPQGEVNVHALVDTKPPRAI